MRSRDPKSTQRERRNHNRLCCWLRPAIRYGHFGAVRCWIFKTHDWRREWESDAGNARESFLESDENSNEKGTLLWFYAAYNDAFMGSKISLKFHVPCDVWSLSSGLSKALVVAIFYCRLSVEQSSTCYMYRYLKLISSHRSTSLCSTFSPNVRP